MLKKFNNKKKLLNNYTSPKNDYIERKQLLGFNKKISINELDESDIKFGNYDNIFDDDINIINQNDININEKDFLNVAYINFKNNLNDNGNEINDNSDIDYNNNNYYANYINNDIESNKNKYQQTTKRNNFVKNEFENIIKISNELIEELENQNNSEDKKY